MILESTIRFKHIFNHCKTYGDLIEQLEDTIETIEQYKSLGVIKIKEGSEDDYHIFEIETEDPKKIKELRRMGFQEIDESNNA